MFRSLKTNRRGIECKKAYLGQRQTSMRYRSPKISHGDISQIRLCLIRQKLICEIVIVIGFKRKRIDTDNKIILTACVKILDHC